MSQTLSVNLGNLVLSFSDALDMAFPSLVAHQQRVAFIAWELAKQANFGRERCENIFMAGLLHDIGALSIEEKKAVHDIDTYDFERHCIRGERLFQLSPWLEHSAPLVRNHHLAWSRSEGPRDTPATVDAQILHLADDLERHIDRGVYILNQVVKQHTYHTFTVLNIIPGFQTIAGWAAYHHERLDGKGYPFKLPEGGIDSGARIMAVADLFTAVAEDRPYRRGMEMGAIRMILRDQADLGLRDARITKLLTDNMSDIRKSVARAQEAAANFYRTELSSAGKR